MNRLLLVFLSLALAQPLLAQPGDGIAGRVDGSTYISPSGAFRIRIPVLPELGGRIQDTPTAVTFQDDFNVLCTVAAIPMDATQRWEYSTRGPKDYLAWFFANFIMPDFDASFPGARVENVRFASGIADGTLFAYIILPEGSMFNHKLAFLGPDSPLPDAKRGNMLFVRNNNVFVLSVELAERVLERSSYNKTTEEEDSILRDRLVALFDKMSFPSSSGTSP
jgi:hypothetical protein